MTNSEIELLQVYTNFLQEEGYIDTDATCETPTAIDQFLKTKDRKIMKTGIELIAEERQRQIEVEGFDYNHDDQNTSGEIDRLNRIKS